ncbi:Hypothetical_protein [Hexamita inflata]|uniref:Hypothetical_protein n=1 Tax=Hexamita inflata TaxID=28002 RepID=A0AA86PZ02_9EUKA|nr:Hypothetical protein HINF_LOCUS34118 [Hexamita inflata]
MQTNIRFDDQKDLVLLQYKDNISMCREFWSLAFNNYVWHKFHKLDIFIYLINNGDDILYRQNQNVYNQFRAYYYIIGRILSTSQKYINNGILQLETHPYNPRVGNVWFGMKALAGIFCGVESTCCLVTFIG